MKNIKISAATPAQLNWLVASIRLTLPGSDVFFFNDVPWQRGGEQYEPATNRDQCVALIESEKIDCTWQVPDLCFAKLAFHRMARCTGPTVLIAAMRAYVTGNLGVNADVPQALE